MAFSVLRSIEIDSFYDFTFHFYNILQQHSFMVFLGLPCRPSFSLKIQASQCHRSFKCKERVILILGPFLEAGYYVTGCRLCRLPLADGVGLSRASILF